MNKNKTWIYIRTQINNFFKKLYGNDSEISSKRVVGFHAFLLLAVIIIVQLCTGPVLVGTTLVAAGPVVPEFMFYGLIALIAGCFGLNTIESIKALQAKTDVATTVAQSDSSEVTNDQAKEIIQSDQPK